jgi:protein TonB
MSVLRDYSVHAPQRHGPAVLVVAIALHVVVIGAALAQSFLEVPPIFEPPLIIELQTIELLPPPPPPAAPAQQIDPVTPPEEVEVHIPQMRPDSPVLEPVSIIESIDLSAMPDLPPPTAGITRGRTDGVEGGVEGGVGSAPAPRIPHGPIRDPDVHAREIFQPEPEYPRRARLARVEGTVTLVAIIRTDGTVGDVKVVQGLGMKCTEAAIEAVRQYRYEPARQNGRPVAQILDIEVHFILE